MGLVEFFQEWSQVHCSFSTPGKESKMLKLKVAHIFLFPSIPDFVLFMKSIRNPISQQFP